MKLIYVIILGLFIISCGAKRNISGNLPANSTNMVFKTQNGIDIVSLGEVRQVDVDVYAASGPNPAAELERSFSGDKVIQILKQFPLGHPQKIGKPASVETGTITIHYRHSRAPAESHRVISIQNNQLLNDKSFPEVAYNSNVYIDRTWLEAQ